MNRILSLIFVIAPLLSVNHAQAATPAENLLSTVADICPQLSTLNAASQLNAAEQDLFFTCRNALNETDMATQLNAAANLVSDETSTMETLSVDITSVQTTTVLSRLQALRSRSALSDLAANIQGKDRAPIYYAGPVTSLSSSDNQAEYSSGRFSVFLNGAFGAGDKSDTTLEPGFDYDNTGVVVGADYRFRDNFFFGAAIGFAATEAEVDLSAGDMDVNGYGFSVYGSYAVEGFYLDGVASYGIKDYEITRNLDFTIASTPGPGTTTVNQTFEADTDASEWLFNLGAGYNFERKALIIGPYVRLNYLRADIDGYTEKLVNSNTNSGFGTALKLEDQDFTSLTTDLGVIVSYAFGTQSGVYTPYARFEWEHEFDSDGQIIKASYVNGTQTTGNVIEIPTDDPDRDYMNFSAGLAAVFQRGFSAFAEYSTIIGLDDVTGFAVNGGIRYEF